jgi:hypothetical protein
MNARPFYTPTTPTGGRHPHIRSISGTTRSPAARQASENQFPFPSHETTSPALASKRLPDDPSNPLLNELARDDAEDEIEEREEEHVAVEYREEDWEGMTPLDLTLTKIGMGRYQKTLLVLCGFGWMADNVRVNSRS